MNKYYHNLGLAFTDTVATHSDRPALIYPEHQFHYAQILGWVESLSVLLLANHLQRGDVIAISNNKRPLSYALMLAALRLGIAYVNIDSAAPLARNLSILKGCNASLLFYDDLLSHQDSDDLAQEHQCPIIALDHDKLPEVTPADRALHLEWMRAVDGATIAYVMFTSGSTGTPKGVAVTHQNVLHFIAWCQNYFHITPCDNYANLSPMYFDNSVFDFFGCFFSGAALTPISRELLTKPYELVAYVSRMQCSIWFSVPSLLIYLMTMKALASQTYPKLRCIVFGGEGYPKTELKKLFELFKSQAKLVNVYGPTECTCICSAYPIDDTDFHDLNGLPPLGMLNPNFDYIILNDQQQEAAKGELCLIGPNVAAGYINDLERSASSFVTLTDSRRFMKKMYKTGDLVQEINGVIYFLGRKDNQIKHMGYRIELEEIEHALAKLPEINQAAVIYQRLNTAYGKLIGFVASSGDLDEQDLLNELSTLLPEYMIPSQLVITQSLPKNANGKVDKRKILEEYTDHALV